MSQNDCVFCAYEDAAHSSGNFCQYFQGRIEAATRSTCEPGPRRNQNECPGFVLLESMRSHWEGQFGPYDGPASEEALHEPPEDAVVFDPEVEKDRLISLR